MNSREYSDLYENYGDFLTPKELAIYLKIHYNTACDLLRTRKIIGKKIGNFWRVPRHRIVDFLENLKKDKVQ